MSEARTIWLVSKYMSAAQHGFESRLFAIAKRMKLAGRNPVIISSDSNHFGAFPKLSHRYTREVVEGCETWWIRTLKYRSTVSLRRVLSWIDFEIKLFLMDKAALPKPDVIVVSSLSLLTIINGLLMRRKYKCKLVFEVRDIWPLTLVEEGGFSRRNPLVLLLAGIERLGYRKADCVVGTMPNLAEHVAAVAGPGRRCECIPFGFDPAFFDRQDPLPAGFLESRVPPGKFVVGYAGSIGLTNALDTIISCAREMIDDPRFFFLFVGGGDLYEKYVAETANLPNVAFAPKVRREQVQELLCRCDVLYFAVKDSLVWRYGLSLNKLTDYMMAAKPVVASYSGFPSMLNESGCGVFVPADRVPELKAMLQSLADRPSGQLADMGKSGRNWLLAHRPWDVIARQYMELCDRLL
jgi:glycosyltransferase involved in cell wall biosynthesis